jgi:hypothetical protein
MEELKKSVGQKIRGFSEDVAIILSCRFIVSFPLRGNDSDCVDANRKQSFALFRLKETAASPSRKW